MLTNNIKIIENWEKAVQFFNLPVNCLNIDLEKIHMKEDFLSVDIFHILIIQLKNIFFSCNCLLFSIVELNK